MEDLAICPRPEGFEEVDMLEALAAVDTLAVGYRTEMGTPVVHRVEASTARRQ